LVKNVSFVLSKNTIPSLEGNCYLSAEYNGENVKTKEFYVSNKIKIDGKIEGFTLNPRESFNLTGTAKKDNEENVNGFIKADVQGLNVSLTGEVVDGVFALSYTLIDNTPAGVYTIDVQVYDKDGKGNVVNQGIVSYSIKVKQVIRRMDLAINAQDILPGNDFVYSIFLYDQSDKTASDNVGVVITRPDNSVLVEKLAKSGESNTIKIETNYAPGYWKVDVSYENSSVEKIFNVQELQMVSYSVVNGSLYVKNIGNIPYTKPIEVLIGEETRLEEVSLDMGEEKKIKLRGDEGEYDLKVNDGTGTQDLGKVTLTGNALSVQDVGEVFTGTSGIFVWGILILIIIYFVIINYNKGDKKYLGSKVTGGKLAPIKISSEKGKVVTESDGSRGEAGVVALKFKGLPSNNYSQEVLREIISNAKSLNAKIYGDQEYRIFVFAEKLTGKTENEMIAVNFAKKVEQILNSHNEKFAEKINFGIGINMGEVIIEKVGSESKVTSIGNTVSVAKRVAEGSKEEAIMSDQVHRRTLGKVRTEKTANGWKIGSVKDRTQHNGFVEGFLNRNKFK
jgi:hypothetical protein